MPPRGPLWRLAEEPNQVRSLECSCAATTELFIHRTLQQDTGRNKASPVQGRPKIEIRCHERPQELGVTVVVGAARSPASRLARRMQLERELKEGTYSKRLGTKPNLMPKGKGRRDRDIGRPSTVHAPFSQVHTW